MSYQEVVAENKRLTPQNKLFIVEQITESFKNAPLDVYFKNHKIAQVILKRTGFEVSSVLVRKLVHTMRMNANGLNIVANSHGYARTENPDKVTEYIESLRERASQIMELTTSFTIGQKSIDVETLFDDKSSTPNLVPRKS